MKSPLANVSYTVDQIADGLTNVSSPEYPNIQFASIMRFRNRFEVTHPTWYNQEFCFKTYSGALKKAKQMIKSEVIDFRYSDMKVSQNRLMS